MRFGLHFGTGSSGSDRESHDGRVIGRIGRSAGVCLTLALTALSLNVTKVPAIATDDPASRDGVIHFAFTRALFAGVNENDARAAVKVYAQVLAGDGGFAIESGPLVLDGVEALAKEIDLGHVDLFSLKVDEYFALEKRGLEGPYMFTLVNGIPTEELLLVVKNDSPVRRVADLRGRRLTVLSDVRATLADVWLEVLCRVDGMGSADRAFSKLTRNAKPTHVVLPVFFGQADACLVTRNSLDLMGELNPQIGRQLRVLAKSEPMVPVVTCFRRGLPTELRNRIIAAAEGSAEKPSFKQLMALFKCDRLSHGPVTVLDTARALLTRHRSLVGGTRSNPLPSPGEPARGIP